ncbi:ubiquinone biosynthesis regulatory protein kinase UbiB [Alteromonas sp. a30]|uniref:ubiquinone biosynthesis regulatory protein kinase UbiB n=1 Tax=Alteromonas sp. a30 TaxID=2730917 RepID=UPI002280EDEF|nr:ubiquinone biosynthesis regulatory protein kinase UbiB [Alteromonas sp. a30]MCY7295352.1 ubiquinone biosynthesis regulatory protein kinase UbiB [Alteromonas sp. a30]
MRIKRFYTIAKTLLQHGLDEWIPKRFLPWYIRYLKVMLFWMRNRYPEHNRGQRLRLALQTLGPVFVKFGQMLSTRRDILPPDIATELAILQDNVEPFSGDEAISIILRSLGINSLDEIFSEFDTTALASASIAQVHAATLRLDAEKVVVKVTRPGIAKTIQADLELMRSFAVIAQKLLPDGKRLRPIEVVEEYRKTIIDELDLMRESANGIQLARNFENSKSLHIPYIYADYCTKDVIVMERIKGVPVSDIDTLISKNVNLKVLAERGVEVFFTQVFRDSFFHADMHPGNIFVDASNPDAPKYIAIDFGIVGTLNREDKRYLAENFVAFFNSDYRKVAELHVDSGWVPYDTNIDEFEIAIRTVCEPIFHKPLAEISFGHVLLQLFNTARRFNMVVQPQLVLLQKTLLYIEGLGRQLYPQLDLWQTAKPFLENWMKEQVGFSAMFKKVQANFPYWTEKMPEVPDLLYDSLKQVKLLPEKQRVWFETQAKIERLSRKTQFYTLIGSTFCIGGLILPLHGLHIVYAAVTVGIGFGCWAKAFLTRK